MTMYATTIRNMQQAIGAGANSIVDLVFYNTYYVATGNTDVVIDSSAGLTFGGVTMAGGSLNIYTAKLVINKSGQSWGGTTAAISLDEGANMLADSGYLSITGSLGQGIVAMNNSHATLFGVDRLTWKSRRLGCDQQLEHRPVHQQHPAFNDRRERSRPVLRFGFQNYRYSQHFGTPTAQCSNLLSSETVSLP